MRLGRPGAAMIEILQLSASDTHGLKASRAVEVLEGGGLVVLPERPFVLTPREQSFLDPAILARSKNVSLDPASGRLGGTRLGGEDAEALGAMIARFSQAAGALLAELTPGYGPQLQKRRTSFRPAAVDQRTLSPRKDDRRLHIDAFPANPVQGRRILRVFANVDAQARARVWEVGEDGFETVARRFAPQLRPPRGAGVMARLRERLGLTKGRRTAYDQAMLALHDAAKLDDGYQAKAGKRRIEFPAGSMWVVYTDATLHAALAGQHALEQTYLLPPAAMYDERQAPVHILEGMLQRPML